MCGGLVQIITYGSEDIFLTGTPQITYFKVVYRRHTNFAIEPIQQHFISHVNFGQEAMSVIDKVGDLMNKVYLEIDIPKVDLIKNSSHWKINLAMAKTQFEIINKFYQLLKDYISTNTDIARKLNILIKTNNISMNDIEETMSNNNFIGDLVEKKRLLQEHIINNRDLDEIIDLPQLRWNLVQKINQIDTFALFQLIIKEINLRQINNLDESDILKRKSIKYLLEKSIYEKMREFYMMVYNIYLEKQKIYQSFLDGSYLERYQFAWVEELGHSIIDYIEIKIGNEKIDKHTGDWLIIFNKIFMQEYQIENYNKMIGNVNELTIFDDQVKNIYKLIIPFQFWFCRHLGLSIPLVALRYHDITFEIKFKELSKVCYVEDNPELLDIANIQSQYNINIIDAKLYVDYVFLDTDERRRFAQSSHEYLIETVQYHEINDIAGKQYTTHPEFSHPTKFVVWFTQPNFYRDNPTGRNKCQWNNYGINNNKTGYTANTSHLRLNSYDRTDSHTDMIYYNYLQPYLYFKHSPTDGLNVYSFAINPTEQQPSSSINLGRIDDFAIVIKFNDRFIELTNTFQVEGIPPGFFMGTYVMSYNILRFMSGMAGVAFQNST